MFTVMAMIGSLEDGSRGVSNFLVVQGTSLGKPGKKWVRVTGLISG
jgi:hypothetical protein